MVLLITANSHLAEGLLALLGTLSAVTGILYVNSIESALRALTDNVVQLILIDGALPAVEIASLHEKYAAGPFPPSLILVETALQTDFSQWERVVLLVKGGPIADLVAVVEELLQ